MIIIGRVALAALGAAALAGCTTMPAGRPAEQPAIGARSKPVLEQGAFASAISMRTAGSRRSRTGGSIRPPARATSPEE